MFDQVSDSVRKATETSFQMQQNLLRQWTDCWTGFAGPQTGWMEPVHKLQREWPQVMAEAMGTYRTSMERQYKTTMKALEAAFHMSQAKDPAELYQKIQDLFRCIFECLHELTEAQMHEFRAAVEKWAEFSRKMAS